MNDRRFAISMHILLLLHRSDEEWLPSDYLAGSMNINPVLVRKELSNLRKFGFIISKEGKNGGSQIAKPANEIYLSDIFKSVNPENILGNPLAAPNPKCPVGRQINQHISNLNIKAEEATTKSLAGVTLAEFNKQFT